MLLPWLLACTPPTSAPVPTLDPVEVAAAGEAVDAAPWGDGAVISWVVDDGEERLARLALLRPDGTLSNPVDLPAVDPVAGLARRPQLASDGDRVVVVWATGDPRSSTIVFAEASSPEGPFTTTLIATGSATDPITFVDQPDVHLSPDGEAWVGFKAEVDHPVVELRIARENSGWVPTPVTPSGGLVCECCPHTLSFLPSGDAWLVLRGNEANVREIHEARLSVVTPPLPGRDLTLTRTGQVSRTGWWVQGCPFDGPDGLALDDERRLATWVDPTSGASRAWVAHTVDDGATWSDARPAIGDDTRIDQQPTFARHPDGRVALAIDDYWTGTAVVLASADAFLDDGEPVADHPDAEVLRPGRPLWDVALVPFADGLLAVGIDESGGVWAEPLSP